MHVYVLNCFSHIQLFAALWTTAFHLLCPWDFPGKNTGAGCHAFLQGIFPTQGSNPGLPHCRQILYQVSHKGSPRILEWVAYPVSSRSSWPRNQTGVSCIVGGFFTNWAIRKAHFTVWVEIITILFINFFLVNYCWYREMLLIFINQSIALLNSSWVSCYLCQVCGIFYVYDHINTK